jgi:predicted amidophosphoribosyltransferase
MQVIFQERTTMAVVIKVSPAGQLHIDKCKSAGLCLGCEKKLPKDEQVRRGLCEACYSAFRRAVRAGASEKQFIKDGKVTNAKVTGRPATNPFTKAAQEG